MSGKLRVFVSSTMRDLPNERRTVVDAVRALNFEPVNAEDLLPTGEGSWERLEREIESSHVLVLLMGKTYGWIPDAGPGAGGGKAVTEMEVDRARALGLPVFAFVQKLEYDDRLRGTPEGDARDRFRQKVMSWSEGVFVTWFQFTDDLERDVPRALVGALSDQWLRERVRERAEEAAAPAAEAVGARPALAVSVPRSLREHVRRRDAVLLTGAGMSLAAGFPSARAMTEVLAGHLREVDPAADGGYRHWPIDEITAVYEAVFGRARLIETLGGLLSPPQGAVPTVAHRAAVALFKRIVTTNFDELLEEAAAVEEMLHRTVAGQDERVDPAWIGLEIVKLDGTIGRPETLHVTERDGWRQMRSPLHLSVVELVRDRPLLVVGSSLREAKLKDLLYSRSATAPGYVVTPTVDRLEERRFRDMGLEPIEGRADEFFQALAEVVGA